MKKGMMALLLGVVLLGQATASVAAGSAKETTGTQIGAGVGSMVGSAVYFPFKASFCIVGGVTSGFAYLFAGSNAAEKMVDTTCRGNWVISPEVVKGKESVHFVGTAR